MNKYLKYILWGVGVLIILESLNDGEIVGVVFGLILIGVTFFSQLKGTAQSYSRTKTSDELLKLKELLDKGIISQVEYDEKSSKLKKNL